MSMLTVKALAWASTVWDNDLKVRMSVTYFNGLIWEVFECPAGGRDISIQLLQLRQGSDAAADYAVKFCILATQSGWNDTSLCAVFREGLHPTLQAELTPRDADTTLSQYFTITDE